MRSRASRGPRVALVALAVAVLFGAALAPTARGGSYSQIPLALDRTLLSNVTGAELTPGASGQISFTVGDPLGAPITSTVVTLAIYAFNAFPGNATSTVPVASPPVLTNTSASSSVVNVTLGTVTPGRSVSGSIGVESSSTTPSGTFAVRTAVHFVENSTAYLLESRGWFTALTWAAATAGPNGTVVLNLSMLGVSGVVPETSVLVSSAAGTWALWALLGVGLVVLAIGGYLYARPAKSRSGARHAAPDETQAPSAFGASRTREGD